MHKSCVWLSQSNVRLVFTDSDILTLRHSDILTAIKTLTKPFITPPSAGRERATSELGAEQLGD